MTDETRLRVSRARGGDDTGVCVDTRTGGMFSSKIFFKMDIVALSSVFD
jgi:hypothetical protein